MTEFMCRCSVFLNVVIQGVLTYSSQWEPKIEPIVSPEDPERIARLLMSTSVVHAITGQSPRFWRPLAPHLVSWA